MKPDEKNILNHREIEAKWQKIWLDTKFYQPNLDNPQKPYYNLMMFPYPSAEGMHVGNMYAQTGGDIHGRLKRMQGYDVFQPMGLDGFGIHSENYALKVGSNPMDQAEKSEANFYRQMAEIGSGYAWDNFVETWKPEYYKWTQWVFIQLFKAGLAYRESLPVNYCPSCKTVLADEQVIDGKCERCSTVVVKKELEQWMFRITAYAESLLQDLDKIDWTEKVKIAQKNWIGKSVGAKISFKVEGTDEEIDVFTTRPDTLYGATFLAVSPEHDFVKSIIESGEKSDQAQKVSEYVESVKKSSEKAEQYAEKEKTGVFSGAYALNPINNQQIPIWIADYVLMEYGTGAIMAVPAHDQRDFEFAKKYDLAIKHVIMPSRVDKQNPPHEGKEDTRREIIIAVVRNKEGKYLCLRWKHNGWNSFVTGGIESGEDPIQAALREVVEETGYTSLKPIRILGGPTEGFFYASHKGVNRQTKAHLVLLELEDDVKVSVSDEELARYDALWLSEQEMNVQGMRHCEYDLIMERIKTGKDFYTGDGVVINSGEWDELKVDDAKEKSIKDLQVKGIGQAETTYHLRDWLISRQRYWGPPIPMIHCDSCAEKNDSWFTTEDGKAQKILAKDLDMTQMAGWYPEENLPVALPRIDDYKPIGDDVKTIDGKTVTSPLGNHPEFYKTTCPACGSDARRETDVSDTFLDSSWYFYRYFSTDDSSHPWTQARAKHWMPVTMYTGGAEHAVLHLFYSRFVTKVFSDLGLISGFNEPFPRFFAHGLIIKDGAKMSKSKGNVVVPDAYVKKYGADTLRTYLMFLGPFDAGGDFRDSGIEGMNRFIKRVWTLVSNQTIPGTPEDSTAIYEMNKAIKGVTEDIESFHYNTAIAKIMIYYNFISKKTEVYAQEIETLVQLLAPFAPHITEEAWQGILGKNGSVHKSLWPTFDSNKLIEATIVLPVQVNGKLRATLELENISLSEDEVVKKAKELEGLIKHIEGKEIKKVIYVPGKVLNFVTS